MGPAAVAAHNYFYPRPPRGGRQQTAVQSDRYMGISIHALREEGDVTAVEAGTGSNVFLSTPSARRATGPLEF